ncbi:phage shock protein C [Litorimonas cladophorae]|uniref:Phage shock protein C n=1 Tax=Litorimonas cladophorae TaxID=1220491 RepID=A0A918KRC0_9PROT|nr:PspC domain-containing protein [Litorimonas cladophorae]GGX73863.1 phage shock protein C [Litorimonas cladophorae]
MSKSYKNPTHRMLNDMNWDGSNDGYPYRGPNKLRRNTVDGKLGGVCAGIGDYLGWDHTMVRIITILLIIFTGLPAIAYVILWVLMPKDDRAPYIREYREQQEARSRMESPVGTAGSKTTYGDVKSKFRSLEVRLQDLERSITSKEWKLNRDFRDLEN